METNENNVTVDQAQIPEPTVSGVYGHSWEVMKKYFPELLLVVIVETLFSLPLGLAGILFEPMFTGMVETGLVQVLYIIVVLIPVSYGVSWVYLQAVRREAFHIRDIFFAYQSFGNILLANLLVFLIVGLGFAMLIIPGIIFACKLSFVPYLVMDKKMEAVEAVRKSWHMTKGHTGTIFMMVVTAVFVGLAGLICFGVGIIPATIWIMLAFAAIYFSVDAKENQEKVTS
jgi:uncharacterized membrane protein